MSLYLIAYDVRSDLRRRRVGAVLERFGSRLQYSVFEAALEPPEVADLRRELGFVLAPDDDLEIIPIDRSTGRRRYRWQREPGDWTGVVVL
ncbi:MAG: CRISPR-associated endonuclease Cas2 [Planctomycetes bacterium]|nr:CRISPR-associated endonuclease Cas2 [Planctomycetota bacterium]